MGAWRVVRDLDQVSASELARLGGGLLGIAELVHQFQLHGARRLIRAGFEDSAQGAGVHLPVDGDVGDGMAPDAFGQFGHRAGVRFGIVLPFIDVRRVLVFVEGLNLGIDLELLGGASEEHGLEADAGRLKRCARLHPDFGGGRDCAIGRGARREEALRVGDHELVLGAQAQEGGAQLLSPGGAHVHLGGPDEDALYVRVIRCGVEAQKDLDKRCVAERRADRV